MPNLKPGMKITGKDRTYIRSIYQVGESEIKADNRIYTKMHLISYDGHVPATQEEFWFWKPHVWVEAGYREATEEEIEASKHRRSQAV